MCCMNFKACDGYCCIAFQQKPRSRSLVSDDAPKAGVILSFDRRR